MSFGGAQGKVCWRLELRLCGWQHALYALRADRLAFESLGSERDQPAPVRLEALAARAGQKLGVEILPVGMLDFACWCTGR